MEVPSMIATKRTSLAIALAAMAMIWTLDPTVAAAQNPDAIGYIEPGTTVQVRTSTTIDESTVDGRVYPGTVEEDVRDANGRIAIPRGSTAELVVRRGPNDELYLDLDSVTINGHRYGVDASRRPVDRGGIDVKNSGIGNNQETIEHVGGGALLGTVIGAIAGGGKGAAIGAVVGAAAGAGTQILTHGRRVNVPAETQLTFRLQSGLDLDVRDTGYDRGGVHYHHYRGEPGSEGR
jgi:outer membrane lipoprotein SlyB